MADALLDDIGKERLRAFSAGSTPAAGANPLALETLARQNISTVGLRSKGWEVFAAQGAPAMDLVITVCDDAAGEVCPLWPGRPVTAHWGVEDPGRFQGSDDERRLKFDQVAGILRRRIERLAKLPFETMERQALDKKVRDIALA